jgi:hypothetical protein
MNTIFRGGQNVIIPTAAEDCTPKKHRNKVNYNSVNGEKVSNKQSMSQMMFHAASELSLKKQDSQSLYSEYKRMT